MDAISKCHNFEIIHGRYISILIFFSFFFNIVCILTLEFNLFLCVRFRGTTKEAFVVYAIKLALDHCHLFTHHHATKVVEATTKNHTNMGITYLGLIIDIPLVHVHTIFVLSHYRLT